MLEQVAKVRNVSQERHLGYAQGVLRLNDATNHHRATIGDKHLRGGLLRDQFGVAADFHAEVRQGILHVHIEEDGSLRSDLRSHGQAKEGTYISGGWRTI